MTYSLVHPERLSRPKVESAPPPSNRPTRRPPWWASWLIALVTALGGGGTAVELIKSSNEQLKLLAEIKAELKGMKETTQRLRDRLDAAEQREARNFAANETRFAVLGAMAQREGYSVRGMDTDQVEFNSTKNAKKPVRAVDQAGRELAVPPPAPPPGVR